MIKKFRIRNTDITLIVPNDQKIDLPDEFKNMTVEEYIDAMIEKLEERCCGGSEGNSGTLQQCDVPAELAVQFECGDCCKKAVLLTESGNVRVDLLNNNNMTCSRQILEKTISDGKVVDKQVMETLTINNLNFFCTLEFGVIELDPEKPVNVGLSKLAFEIDCGPCCKKILNAKKQVPFGPFSLIFPPRGESLIVKTFNGGKLVEKQCVQVLITLQDRICSIEEDAIEIDP